MPVAERKRGTNFARGLRSRLKMGLKTGETFQVAKPSESLALGCQKRAGQYCGLAGGIAHLHMCTCTGKISEESCMNFSSNCFNDLLRATITVALQDLLHQRVKVAIQAKAAFKLVAQSARVVWKNADRVQKPPAAAAAAEVDASSSLHLEAAANPAPHHLPKEPQTPSHINTLTKNLLTILPTSSSPP